MRMNKFRMTALAAAVVPAILMSHSVSANEADQPDPADLTRPKTFVWAQAGYSKDKIKGEKSYSTGVGKITGGLSGNFTEKAQYMGLLEQGFDRKGAANTRGRLFTTFDTGNSVMSRVGLSVDYIRHAKTKDTTAAVGVIGKFDATEWLAFYPNLAAVEAKVGATKEKSKGYQFNLFTSVYLNDKGMYSMIMPQYTDLKDVTVKKLEVSLGAPLTADAKTWWDVKVGYTKNEGKKRLATFESDGAELLFGVSHYF